MATTANAHKATDWFSIRLDQKSFRNLHIQSERCVKQIFAENKW